MIDDARIDTFPAATRQAIRATIERMTRLGHDPEHLTLTRDGVVTLDHDDVDTAALATALDPLGTDAS